MKHKKLIIGGVLLVLIVVFVLILNYQKILPSFPPFNQSKNVNKPYVDPRIYEEFKKGNEWVEIMVYTSSTIYLDLTIKSIPPSEFKLKLKTDFFAGEITQKGFEVLVKNPHIVRIEFSRTGEYFLPDTTFLINATAVWDIGYGGEGQTVCIIDSGVNYSNSNLGGCFGNGTNFSCKVIGGYDFINNNSNPMDDYGHGTHVAGIVAANGSIKGIAPNAKIIALKVSNGTSGPKEYAVKAAVDWCRSNASRLNISIITMSFGLSSTLYSNHNCEPNTSLSISIKNAHDEGIFVDSSSGNDQSSEGIRYPACTLGTTSVGATSKVDRIANYTNRGSNLDLLAPGGEANYSCGGCNPNCCAYYSGIDSGIKSIATSGEIWNCWGNQCGSTDGKFINMSGTSMAAPHVAGTAALLLQLNPSLTPNQIKDVLNLTGKPISDVGYSNRTYSRIDVYKAFMAVNASLLQIVNLTELSFNSTGTIKIFEFVIRNANLSNISDISWQASMGDGNTRNSTLNISLVFGETSINLLRYDFQNPGTFNVNVSVRAGNLIYSKNITVYIPGYNLSVTAINDLQTIGLSKIIEFKIKNYGSSSTNNITWRFDFGDGTNTSAQNIINLSAGEEAFVYLRHNYGNAGNYTVNATASNGDYISSRVASISVPQYSGIGVYNLSVLNSSLGIRIFEFYIKNINSFNLTGVYWNLTFGDAGSVNSTQPIFLNPNEAVFVIAKHNYTSAGTYTVNATARNGTLIDFENITISVS